MKLYYGVNACSLAPLIAATEAGIDLDLTKVDIYKSPHRLADGTNFANINPSLYVPVLELDNGSRLTEVAVILQYLADIAPDAALAPMVTSFERYRLQEWLNFIATELHKSFSPWLFHQELGETAQSAARAKIALRLEHVEDALYRREYLLGSYGVADSYLFTVLGWAKFAKVPLESLPNILDWQNRVSRRPAVQNALLRHV